MVKNYLNINYYLANYLKKMPAPPLHPQTQKPASAKDLAPIFPQELIKQEMSLEKEVAIPEAVQELYQKYRPTPLIRADRLEKELATPAEIYYKNEGATLTGSHKINTALAQAYYNAQEGIKTLVTETGAGQWGTALSLASKFLAYVALFLWFAFLLNRNLIEK